MLWPCDIMKIMNRCQAEIIRFKINKEITQQILRILEIDLNENMTSK